MRCVNVRLCTDQSAWVSTVRIDSMSDSGKGSLCINACLVTYLLDASHATAGTPAALVQCQVLYM